MATTIKTKTMSKIKTETQIYKVLQVDNSFEIRYYPPAILAKISTQATSYRDLGYSGFGKLAKFIFGGNSKKEQIAMTSPVHMEIGATKATMAFVMPDHLKLEDIPTPNNGEIRIETSEPEYIAAIQFSGFASARRIEKYKLLLEKMIEQKGLSYYGNFRFLGYNPPYQLFGRRNEIIISVKNPELTVSTESMYGG